MLASPRGPADDPKRLAKPLGDCCAITCRSVINLSMTRSVAQRHKHLLAPPLRFANIIRHDRDAAGEPALIHCPAVDTQYR